jgi:Tol biopolymer transport system component
LQLTLGDDNGYAPAWSADGRTIAFAKEPGGFGPREIYLMDADGSGQRPLLATGQAIGGDTDRPGWSPDGRRIVFECGDADLQVVSLDGSRRWDAGTGGAPAWSPDGRRLAFECDSGICVMSADGTRRRTLRRNGDTPTWSSDVSVPACSAAISTW